MKLFRVIRSKDRANNRGVSTLELAIALPLLLTFVIGVTDISRMLFDYLIMGQIAREGARTLSQIPDISQGSYANLEESSTNKQHLMAQLRANLLLDYYKPSVERSTVSITSDFTPLPMDPNIIAQAGDDTISFKITATYQSIFPMFRNFQLSVTKVSPYLFDARSTT